MIQRVIYNVLTTAIQAVNDNPQILEELFEENWGLTRTEVDGIKTFFSDQTPGVIHNYARSDSEFPLYSIVLSGEQEAENVLADDAGQIEDPDDPNFGADCYTAIWQHSYDVMCFAEHPDAVQYMYEVAKNAFIASTAALLDAGIFELNLSGGDVAPDPRYVPEHLFMRRLIFSCQREFLRTDVQSKFAKAFEVVGIHVIPDGSSSSIGGVKANVTPYVEGS